ncbi:flavin reductase family protein [Microlunatus capsulatus]|uniref:Flavin reductase (DIM6/NTAB) family NADH-FMN oxidoreductase RutF n=1 Tax=Microlunatus capsulatus TaxID=99117 RepID=A0ABS4Z2C6_9ACTN|nr:flavin reductase family protein [Microlunatus capsulatus]MBP2415129.1 flavin reductase (DIM6/NTAB) family NADH-FMN oxidoreductase RutF [Microlunatus capsulatus]
MTARSWPPGAVPAEPLDPGAFRSVFRRHPAGVAVVTLADGDRPVGFTATSVISVSAEPPVLVFSVAGTSSSWPALSRATSLVVNFLAAEQVDVSARFATSGIDRFAGVAWQWLPSGEPVVDGVPSWVRGEVLQRTAVGSSFLVAVLATRAEQRDGSAPLVYHDRAYHRVDDGSAV